MTIRHILFDADGVLQELPGGWHAALEPYLGERADAFLRETWKDELPMQAGRGDYLPVLAETMRRYGVVAPVEQVYRDVWQRIDRVEESFRIVAACRAAGYGVHLGTNQESYRGAYMAGELGYDAIFDVNCYSHELGVAKPDPGFFLEAARRIGADPAEILFIDDMPPNVEGALSVGLAAIRWTIGDGHDLLRVLLADQGVVIDRE